MRLDEASGGRVYVDTNVLYMYLRADVVHLPIIQTFFRRVIRGDIEAIVGVPVLDELSYRLLLARLRDEQGRNPLDALREDLVGAIENHGPLIRNAIEQFLSLPNISVASAERVDGKRMLDNMIEYKLLPRDALHVAIMQRLGIELIASDDMDFDRVQGLKRLWVISPATKD